MFVQRFKGFLYLLSGVSTWFFVKTMSEWLVARRYFPIPTSVMEMGEFFYHGLGLSAALAVILGLYFYGKSRVFIDEVAVETSKVTWPTMKDTVNATIVVSIAIIIAGFALGAVDWAIGSVFNWSFKALLNG